MNSAMLKKVAFIAAVALVAGWAARRVAGMDLPVVSAVAAQAVS